MIKCKTKNVIIDTDNRLWPCCWVLTKSDLSFYLADVEKREPFWNSLSHHTINEILNHEVYTDHFNTKHWEDEDACDPICKIECTLKGSK